MIELLKVAMELLKGAIKWEATLAARLFALIIAPGAAFAIALLLTGDQAGLHIYLQPVKVVHLKSEPDAANTYSSRSGALIFLEPVPGEYHFTFDSSPRTVLTSLSPDHMEANSGKLRFGPKSLSASPPFLGEKGVVAIAVDSRLDNRFLIPGGDRKVEEVEMLSDQAMSVASGIVFACLFALGIAFSTLFPLVEHDKDVRSEKGA